MLGVPWAGAVTECLRCGAKSQLYLCQSCADKVRDMLIELPWWLDRLNETAIGQAALGTPARKTRREPRHLNGDDTVASHIEAFPDDTETDLDEARRQREKAARRHALAAGGIHTGAAELLDTIANFLSTWIRDLCETNRIEPPTLRYPKNAVWLAERLNLLAGHLAADEFADELSERLRAIRRIINRPTPPRFIGPCPGSLDTGHDRDCHRRHPHRCDTALSAHRGAIEVTCPSCRAVHNIERLEDQQIKEIEHQRFTRAELHKVLEWLGEPIPRQTMHDWLKPRKLTRPPRIEPPMLRPAGYRRTDGRIGAARHSDDDKPVYRLADVRRLRNSVMTCENVSNTV